jgi:hypothetical protein
MKSGIYKSEPHWGSITLYWKSGLDLKSYKKTMIETQLKTHAFLQAEISASFMDSPTDFPSSLHSPGKVGPGSCSNQAGGSRVFNLNLPLFANCSAELPPCSNLGERLRVL